MHNWDPQTDQWRRDERIVDLAKFLVEDDVKLNQTMLYFKPPGGRGQAFHQDNQYIRMGPVVACWICAG